MQRMQLLGLVVLAAGVTILNGFKPLVVDDPVYLAYARHLSQAPLDPYGFQFFGTNPAMDTLVPPVVPYWWAGAIRLCGERPFCWKLTLFPFVLMLFAALHALFSRWARGLEGPLVVLTGLAPVCLPAWNYMLDLPALAVGLAALVLYLRAHDRSSWGLTVAAGLLGGLALQTKYTAMTIPLVILLHGLLQRRLLRALVVAGLAWGLFVGWEGWLLHQYGVSHFLHHVGRRDAALVRKLRLVLPLLSTLGAVAPMPGLLALAARGVRWRGIILAGLGVLLPYVLVAAIPESWQVLVRAPGRSCSRLDLAGLLFALSGGASLSFALWSVVGGGWWMVGGEDRSRTEEAAHPSSPSTTHHPPSTTLLLLGWFGVELLAYFALTPFPAARRVLGLSVVLVLLSARATVQLREAAAVRSLLWSVAAGSAFLGVSLAGIDWWEASEEQAAVREAITRVRQQDASGRIWYTGEGGGTLAAEQLGAQRYLPGTCTRPGDWYVVERRVCQGLPADLVDAVLWARLTRGQGFPLSTFHSYHGSGTPVRRHDGPRVELLIFRRPTGFTR
jgi:hypothetical protein